MARHARCTRWLLIFLLLACLPRAPRAQLVLTEIMYRPFAGHAEWVEIWNPGPGSVDLAGWRLGDLVRPAGRVITTFPAVVPPNVYAVITPDRAAIVALNPAALVIEMPVGFPGLNNDGDAVVLRDATGAPVDSVRFDDSWGGGVGISLERIRPDRPANDRANWNSSPDPRGATPGEPNALSAAPGAVSLTAEPNPFSPDGDGFEDATALHYTLPFAAGRVTVEIYDVGGRLVRRLRNNALTAAAGAVPWDGRDTRGRRVPLGLYIVLLEAIDDPGGRTVQAKAVVAVAARL